SGGLVSSAGLPPSAPPTRSLPRRFAGAVRSRGSLAALARAVTCSQFMRWLLVLPRGEAPRMRLGFGGHRGDERLDVAEREGKRLELIDVALDLGHVVGHHHPVEADLPVNAHRLQHVDVAVVDERFAEVQEAARYVAE